MLAKPDELDSEAGPRHFRRGAAVRLLGGESWAESRVQGPERRRLSVRSWREEIGLM